MTNNTVDKWNWEHREDNYPREKWGNYWQFQNLVYNNKIFNTHKRYKHTKNCQIYSPTWCVLICKVTGEKIISDLDRQKNL